MARMDRTRRCAPSRLDSQSTHHPEQRQRPSPCPWPAPLACYSRRRARTSRGAARLSAWLQALRESCVSAEDGRETVTVRCSSRRRLRAPGSRRFWLQTAGVSCTSTASGRRKRTDASTSVVATRVRPLATTMAVATSSKDRLAQAAAADPPRRETLLRAIVDEPSGPCSASITRS